MVVIVCFSPITTIASTNTGIDSTMVVVRQPDAGFVDSYRNQKQFNYSRAPIAPNFFRQLWDYFVNRLGGWGEISKSIPLILKIFASIIFLLFLLLTIVKTQLYTVFYSEKAVNTPDFKLPSMEDQNIDFDQTIRSYIDQKQYRQAIRWLYLKIFNQLKNKEYIRFSKEKTNVDYLRDLGNSDLKSGFLLVTNLYNRIWYGDVEITEDQFLRFEKVFHSFYRSIDVQE